jgi:hypothetical protein
MKKSQFLYYSRHIFFFNFPVCCSCREIRFDIFDLLEK